MGMTCVKVELSRQNRNRKAVTSFDMKSITQDLLYKQAVFLYSYKYGVTNGYDSAHTGRGKPLQNILFMMKLNYGDGKNR